MPTVETNPYGILRLISRNTPSPAVTVYNPADEFCIGGRHDSSLWFIRVGFLVPNETNKIVFVDKFANAYFSRGVNESANEHFNPEIPTTNPNS